MKTNQETMIEIHEKNLEGISGGLNIHESYNGTRYYECKKCGMKFKSQNELSMHFSVRHMPHTQPVAPVEPAEPAETAVEA